MLFAGMIGDGVKCYRDVRLRYDGEKRNPWNEPECGHHYARAMSAWSGVLATSGFRYHGVDRSVEIKAPAGHRCFWATGSGWGTFEVTREGATIRVDHGLLSVQRCIVNGRSSSPMKSVSEGETLRV
jgi:rhamnogalacturonyl hydrolase YesR